MENSDRPGLPGWDGADLTGIPAATLDLADQVWCAAHDALCHDPDPCGGRTFYTAKQWAERGEKYGCESDLVIVHDGGDFAALINLDYECYALVDAFDAALRKRLGARVLLEPCTCWYAQLIVKPRWVTA